MHVPGLSSFRVHSKDDVSALLRKGLRNRAIRATDLNAESSRSHTILQLFVTVEEADDQGLLVLRRSTFSLVDLAGSEKWRTSLDDKRLQLPGNNHAENSQQAQQKEMLNINSSLHVLGNCVSALLEPGRKHIPFRDSVLTRLLQDALGGNGRTVLIATVHEDSSCREESYSTLQFASRASKIQVTLSASEGVSEGITLEGAKRQIKMLRAKIQEILMLNSSGHAGAALTASGEFGSSLGGGTGGVCLRCDHFVEQVQRLRAENNTFRAQLNLPLPLVPGSAYSEPPLQHNHVALIKAAVAADSDDDKENATGSGSDMGGDRDGGG